MVRNRQCSPQTYALLAVLLQRPSSWRYGYDLSTETELKSGTLYPILMRLCDRGLLDSKWADSPERGRPPRHMYRLTTAGSVYAKQQLANQACGYNSARLLEGGA
jgi:DNA-binding PadR family transcriptional regulator